MAREIKAGRRWLQGLRGRGGGRAVSSPVFSVEEIVATGLIGSHFRGAYCAMVIISLLDLPLTLPPDAEARQYGLESFTSGLSEYLARCKAIPHP